MKKTSVYLTDVEIERLERLSRIEGVSQAAIIRKAIAGYLPAGRGDRDFAMSGVGQGPGDSVADHPEEELLKGFGE